jgi:outer membrane protein TolC
MIAITALLAGIALAAGANDGACLSLLDATDIAARTSPEVAVAAAEADEARADLDAARATFRPQLSAFTRTGVGDTGLVDSQVENQVGVRVSQRLFDFSKSKYRNEALASSASAREADRADRQIDAAFSAGAAYLDILRQRRKIEIATSEAHYLRDLSGKLQSLATTGAVTGAEQADAETELADIEATISTVRRAERNAVLALSTALGAAPAEPCPFAAINADDIAPKNLGPEFVEAAIDANPRLEAAQSAVDKARAESRLKKRERLPDIDVVGIVSYSYDDILDDWGVRERVGVNLSAPIYAGGSIGASNRGAAARLSRAQSAHEAEKRILQEEINAAYQSWLIGAAEISARRRAAEAKAKQFEFAARSFDGGFMTLRDLIEIRTELTHYEMSLTDAEVERAQNALRLRLLSAPAK